MAGPINQARAKISKIFNGEPQSYTRFNLDQNTDGENSHVEVKLEGEEDVEGTEAGRQNAASTYTQRPLRGYKNIIYGTLLILLIFLGGYLIGYVTHRKPGERKTSEAEGTSCSSVPQDDTENTEDDGGDAAVAPEPSLDWSDLTNMLQNRLSSNAFDQQLRIFATDDHVAGSAGDEALANKVLDVFKSLEMSPWSDEHYVQLQVPSNNPNKVILGSEEIGSPKGFLAYSGTGTKQGKVVYGNYGQMEDLKYMKSVGVDLKEKVVLLRTGKISLAEKVANVAEYKGIAVLIYPDPADDSPNTEIYGHVHFGTGDPYTPGFPSFNHTQFPPAKSSGLPEILAQTITQDMALKIHNDMGGVDAPANFKGDLRYLAKYRLGGQGAIVTVTVNNVLVDTRIHNVFGVIKGFVDPDRYVVIGAQRDSFKTGFAKSTVGTCLLVELARAITDMMKAGFKPRRSIVFASWSAGDYGSVGSTEWLEGYLASLDRRAFTYISLDGAVLGAGAFKASASPMLQKLLKETLNEVKSLPRSDKSLFQNMGSVESFLEPMKMEDGAYPFLAFSGIPSVSFHFVSNGASSNYKYYGTDLDNKDNLAIATGQRLGDTCVAAAQVAGQMALRLVHDHILRLEVASYTPLIKIRVAAVNRLFYQLKQSLTTSAPLNAQWLISASGSFGRAVDTLISDIQNSDLENKQTCRNINDRIMRVEHNLLSPYVSPRDVPFRHIIFGIGNHTVSALIDHLGKIKELEGDTDVMRNQFALTTWTIQGCANDLAGDVWALDNEI